MTRVAYVDASAIVKLIVDEPGSGAMRRWNVEADRVLTSRVGIIEATRAAGRRDHDPAHLRSVLSSLDVIELDAAIGGQAGSLHPLGIRALDAIHVASALAAGSELDSFVTYDERQAAAARGVGLPVVIPAD